MSQVVGRVERVSRPVRIASVNVNGIRAATRKGMLEWLDEADVDLMALQEVRADADQLRAALPGWHVELFESQSKGRAGVAVAARDAPVSVLRGLGDDLDDSGRWIEAQFDLRGAMLRIVSAYVHTGEAGEPRQETKHAFLRAMERRMAHLADTETAALVMGDLNVAHTERDIRNWKGNLKKAGFLPRERAHLDRMLATAGESVTCTDRSTGQGLGWVDVGREAHPDVDGPYTWWSMRGRAFDTDTGWRIDYHLATPALAARASGYHVVRAGSWDTRFSDHAPVVADYALG